jgi:8-oxo-dGTP diphosphatase
MEEIGQEIEIGELLFIREYIGKNHEHASSDFALHQVEYYFSCQLKRKQAEISNGTNPDSDQIGMEWLPIQQLFRYRLYPKDMRTYIIKHVQGEKTPIYLGDLN